MNLHLFHGRWWPILCPTSGAFLNFQKGCISGFAGIYTCKTRRSGQITNIIFRGNRDGSWDQIWVISGSFMCGGGPSNIRV